MADRPVDGVARRVADVVAEQLTDDAQLDRLDVEDQRAKARALIVEQVLRVQERRIRAGAVALTDGEQDQVAGEAYARLFGLGRIQRHLDDPLVSDIEINGCDRVFVKLLDGTRQQVGPVADSDEELVEQLRTAAARLGRTERRFDAGQPALQLQLPDGARLFALMAVADRPSVAIRKHQFELDSLDKLRERGSFDGRLQAFLSAAVAAHLNIVVCGDVAAGKTTLMRALINEVAPAERLVTIEDNLELGIDRYPDRHPNLVTLEERTDNVEGHGTVSMAELVRHSLRMNADRVFVGEVRGGEALPMLQAMSQGATGSMCTVHSRSAETALSRLQFYLKQDAAVEVDVSAWLLAESVDLVVHVSLLDDRRVTTVLEVRGHRGDRVVVNHAFRPDATGRAAATGTLSDETAGRLVAAGLAPAVLAAGRLP